MLKSNPTPTRYQQLAKRDDIDIIEPHDSSDSTEYPAARSQVSDDMDGFDGDMLSPPPDAIPDPGQLGGSSSSSSSSAKGKKPVIITKDEEYFMESAFMVFQVERCLFRVPSYLLSNESHVFGGMFRLPQPYPHENGLDAEGSSEANPIILPDEFTKVDFRCLLKALYPLSFTPHLTLSKDEWISVLKLSTKWYFLNLRETAISELEGNSAIRNRNASELTSLDKITYGRKYYVSSWLVSGLVDLVMREASINDDEALDIDSNYPTTAYKLYRARELRWRGFLTSRPAAVKEIESLFENELTQVRSDEKAYEAPEVEIELEVPEKISMTLCTIPTPTPKQETPRHELVGLNSDDEEDETEYEEEVISTHPEASPPPLIRFGQPSFGGRGFGGRGRGFTPKQTRGRGGRRK